MTEIVRCKSKHEEEVIEALEECTGGYFDRTMAFAAARVVVAIGKGRRHIRQRRYEIAESDMPRDNLRGISNRCHSDSVTVER